MTGTEWAVLVGGAAAIAWVNWYFFLAERSPPARGDGPPAANKERNVTNPASASGAARGAQVVEDGIHGDDVTRLGRG